MRRVVQPSARSLSASGFGRFIPAVVLLGLLSPGAANCVQPAAASSASVSAVVTPAEPSVTLLPEVRLRKLHLVRPDLIPYPLCYEVYC